MNRLTSSASSVSPCQYYLVSTNERMLRIILKLIMDLLNL